jgi:hypothetical protein
MGITSKEADRMRFTRIFEASARGRRRAVRRLGGQGLPAALADTDGGQAAA